MAVSNITAVRLPRELEEELASIAQRDCNSISATTRRLLALAVRLERRSADGGLR